MSFPPDGPASPAAQTLRLGLPRLPSRSLGLKFLLVCFLALAMAIPTLFVNDIARERAAKAQQVSADIGSQRGGAQAVSGPILLVPYTRPTQVTEEVTLPDGTKRDVSRSLVERGWWVFFAEDGRADARLAADVLRRSIYKVPTYLADVAFQARFDMPAALAALPANATLDWQGARMLAWVSDLRGVKDAVALTLPDGSSRPFEPTTDRALAASQPLPPGVQVAAEGPVDLHGGRPVQPVVASVGGAFGPDTKVSVSMKLRVSGVDRLSIAAFAQDTKATMSGNWDDPKFEGAFLADRRRVGDDVRDATGAASGPPTKAEPGTFEAEWRAPFLARGLARNGALGGEVSLGDVAAKDFAVTLIQRSEVYVGVQRALRYSLLFVGTVFLAYFLFEATGGGRAHPAQYLLVGLAQSVFYLLLLSFAEVIGFKLAFLIAAAPTVALSALYAGAVFRSKARGFQALFAFAVVYALMYVLMTLEDQALLAGSLVAFAGIAAVMWLTRDINWYGDRTAAKDTGLA